PGIRVDPLWPQIAPTPLPHLPQIPSSLVLCSSSRSRRMVELSLVASAALPRAIIHPEHQGPYKAPKILLLMVQEFQILLPVHGRKQDALRFGSVQFNAQHLQGVGRPMRLLSDNNQSAGLYPMIEKPVLVDIQGLKLSSCLE
ncbi:hypothetical protein B296_00037060, partial [Ensete ventricosum]